MIDREALLDALGERADRALEDLRRERLPRSLELHIARVWRDAFNLVAELTQPKEAVE